MPLKLNLAKDFLKTKQIDPPFASYLFKMIFLFSNNKIVFNDTCYIDVILSSTTTTKTETTPLHSFVFEATFLELISSRERRLIMIKEETREASNLGANNRLLLGMEVSTVEMCRDRYFLRIGLDCRD